MKYLIILFSISAFTLLAFTQPEKTTSNLQEAALAEMNASRRYQLYAEKASEEGYEEIAKLFRAISKSEDIHRLNHERALEIIGSEPPSSTYGEFTIKTTKENLEMPIESEKEEAENLYPTYIEEAIKEKVESAVQSFTYAMKSETQHEKLLKDALKNFGKNKKKDYYVSNVTGETFSAPPASPAPKPKLRGEQYLWIE